MTTKQLQDKISELEKRINLLENLRPIINVYPYQQQIPVYPPWNANGTGGVYPTNNPMPLTTC